MAGEAFTALMAAAEQSQSEAAIKKARLKALQESAESRAKQAELAAKEREKQDRWNTVLENHEKDVQKSVVPKVKPTPSPPKPKILQQGRGMTFKKLLKEAAKIDTSTFKVGPKVKVQNTNKSSDNLTKSKSISSTTGGITPQKTAEKEKSVTKGSAKLERSSALERSSSNISRSVSPKKLPHTQPQPSQLSSSPSAKPSKMGMSSNLRRIWPSRQVDRDPYGTGAAFLRPFSLAAKQSSYKAPIPSTLKYPTIAKAAASIGGGKDAKTRLKQAFNPGELIPLAQGPRRDLRSIEEIQNDMWRKKGKDYPSINGVPKDTSSSSVPAKLPSTSKSTPLIPGKAIPSSKPTTTKPQPSSKKRARGSSSPSSDSFIASEDEKFDYRAEIRAMFKRPTGPSPRIVESDDSDMEATGIEMEKEEARAARLARLEDEEEERRLEERARAKKRRRLETGKQMSRK